MGRGDKKSRKGKIAMGSYGNTRRKRAVASEAVTETKKTETAKPKRTRTKKEA